MSQLKLSYIQEIKDALTSSCFSLEDFELVLPQDGQDCQFFVKFRHQPGYSYEVIESCDDDKALTAFVSPGNYKTKEEWGLRSFQSAIRRIPEWCRNIRDDLYSLPPNRDHYEDQKKQVEKYIDYMFPGNPEERFSHKELKNVNKGFDNIYKKLEELQEKLELTNKQLDEIKKTFHELKTSAQAYPRGMWSKITSNKWCEKIVPFLPTKDGVDIFLYLAKLAELGEKTLNYTK